MRSEPLALALLRLVAERGARTGFIDTPAGPMRFAVRGPEGARPLLVLHGLSDSIPGWARAASELARSHRVHLLDLPGHGLSGDPPDWRLGTLLSAVESYALTLDRPLVVGHSLGGWLALKLLARRPRLASGLVVINPAGATVPAEELQDFLGVLSPATRADVRRYLSLAFRRPPLALRLAPGEVIKAMHAKNARGFLTSLEADDFLAAGELRALDLPLRLVWGRHDRFLPAASLPFFREHLRGAELVLLERAGHCPHLEAPADLARAIAAPFRD